MSKLHVDGDRVIEELQQRIHEVTNDLNTCQQLTDQMVYQSVPDRSVESWYSCCRFIVQCSTWFSGKTVNAGVYHAAHSQANPKSYYCTKKSPFHYYQLPINIPSDIDRTINEVDLIQSHTATADISESKLDERSKNWPISWANVYAQKYWG